MSKMPPSSTFITVTVSPLLSLFLSPLQQAPLASFFDLGSSSVLLFTTPKGSGSLREWGFFKKEESDFV
jgi:hypothetical protein